MTTIERDAPVTNVLVRFAVSPSDAEELVDLARATQPIFAAQPGFIAGSLLRSADGGQVVQFLQWRSMEDNLACMQSPDWNAEAGRRFMAFIQSGKATMEPQVFEVVG